MKNEIVLFGAGIMCQDWLTAGFKDFQDRVCFIVDNDPKKIGTTILGKNVVSPDSISDWKKYKVIIVSNRYMEISQQLDGYGLIKGIDYISYSDYAKQSFDVKAINEILTDVIFEDETCKEFIKKISSKEEYEQLCSQKNSVFKYEDALNKLYKKKIARRVIYPGYCKVCRKEVDFTIDYLWTDGSKPAWRETVFCPHCDCNSRMRFIIDYVKNTFNVSANIYICEQTTATYRELEKIFPNIIGSEYLGDNYTSGQVVDGIMHQDVLNLSFDNETFDCIISADVYEHVKDYSKAFQEAFRCLQKGGKLIFSIPIFKDRENSEIRTVIENGQINYIKPKVYHGNPISNEGSLVFTDFGWDVLDVLRSVGFSEVSAIAYFSVEKGYFGEIPLIFEARK